LRFEIFCGVSFFEGFPTCALKDFGDIEGGNAPKFSEVFEFVTFEEEVDDFIPLFCIEFIENGGGFKGIESHFSEVVADILSRNPCEGLDF